MQENEKVIRLIKGLSRGAVVLVFWGVLLLSMLLADHLDAQTLLFLLAKSLFVSALLWVFLIIALDAIIKVMLADAQGKKVDRVAGGLSYHLVEPSPEEIQYLAEHPEENAKKSGKS